MSALQFSREDRRQLAERGVNLDEAHRQFDRLHRPPSFAKLVRPCTVGDGIDRLTDDDVARLGQWHAEAAAAGRLLKFVPASGAATRMFADLHFFHRGAGRAESWPEVQARAKNGGSKEQSLVMLLRQIRRFAFHDDLEDVLRRSGEPLDGLAEAGAFQPILDALLDEDGLGYDSLPKGLIAFHHDEAGGRTAFEEHLVEAVEYVRDGSGLCRLHLTVSPDSRARFDQLLHEAEARFGPLFDVRFEVGYSFQKSSTDTLATDAGGALLRDDDGRLRFRPAGHGSLIENLNDLGADIVFIKNIDNVQPDRVKPATYRYKAALAGELILLQGVAFEHLETLREAEPPEQALGAATEFLARQLNVEPTPAGLPPSYQCRRAFLIDRLNRPIRICGVVPATGEPGGGPFWVRGEDGSVSIQIVESAQVDSQDEEQQRIWRSSTHFNPVDLVCGLRDANGKPHELSRFVDRDAELVTTKSQGGRDVTVLERPGLWNGAMAGWNTVLVEVPIETFSPVKTVFDLLRDEHQPT